MEIETHADIAKLDVISLLSLEFPWIKFERIEHIAQKIVDDVFMLALEEMAKDLWADDEDEDDLVLADMQKDILDLKRCVLDLSKRIDRLKVRSSYDYHATGSHSNGLENPWHDYGLKRS